MKYYTGKVHSKFQVPNMFAVQMDVPFVNFQYSDLKVLLVLYLLANPDFQKIITLDMNNIFSFEFLHLNELVKNNKTCFWTPRE